MNPTNIEVEVNKPVSVEELAAALREGKCKVKFKKVSGEVTERIFALDDKTIAESGWKPKEGAVAKKPHPDVLVVWEVETKMWKSFRKSGLLSWSKVAVDPPKPTQIEKGIATSLKV
jgi:WYL_2, Sm-like SH3 beta-barrel fold